MYILNIKHKHCTPFGMHRFAATVYDHIGDYCCMKTVLLFSLRAIAYILSCMSRMKGGQPVM